MSLGTVSSFSMIHVYCLIVWLLYVIMRCPFIQQEVCSIVSLLVCSLDPLSDVCSVICANISADSGAELGGIGASKVNSVGPKSALIQGADSALILSCALGIHPDQP